MHLQETFTFKMRRKYLFLIASLLLVSTVSRALGAAHQVCPDRCECYVDLQYEYDEHTAECDQLVWNRMYFPNIVQLKMKLSSNVDQCRLPNITAKMFPNLQRLDMSNCSLTSVPSPDKVEFKNLRSVDLSNNLIKDIPSNAFASFRQLQHLTLDHNPLNPQSPPAIESTSLYELSLDSCRIRNVSTSTFVGLPNLKYVSLSNNSIGVLPANTFPEGVRTVDLSNNTIVNVPISEFLRLGNLAQLNLAANPVNCTCPLMGFQDWLTSKTVLFVEGITCAYPRKYAGRKLSHISEWDMCDSKVLEDASSSTETCAPNQICNNGVVTDDSGYVNDENDDALKRDEVIPVSDKSLIVEDVNQNERLADGGSGDGDGTDMPLETSKSAPSKTLTTTTTAATSSEPVAKTAAPSSDGVVKVEHELSSTAESSEIPSTSETTLVSVSNSTVAETTQPAVENETVGGVASDANSTNTQLHEPLRHDSGHKEMYSYLIPALAVLLIGLVCLAVYCSQCASRNVDTSYKQSETNVEGAELQEVSLLPDNNHAAIVKHSNKYPGEKENGQTERLMSDHEQTNGGNSIIAEVNGNGSQHSNETIECCKLPNGQSATNQNVECTVVRVTTLPDSVPKTAVIRDL